jgi:hypothetical protein
MENENPIDMAQVRANVVQRILDKIKARDNLRGFVFNVEHSPDIDNVGRRDYNGDIVALSVLAESTAFHMENDMNLDIEQLGFLIARDVIQPMLRDDDGSPHPTEGAVVWITSNRYMPPWRDLEDVEAIWQAEGNEDGYCSHLIERIEEVCGNQLGLFIATPDYDNALYAVDLKVWEYIDPDDQEHDPSDLNDEWRRIEDE